jgi:hypothetical protein
MDSGHVESSMVIYNNAPVIIAGIDTNTNAFSSKVESLFENDLQNDWKPMESLPYALSGHSAISTVDGIIVFGRFQLSQSQ